MTSTHKKPPLTVEEKILNRLGILDYDGVYWIGRKAERLTFLSQQQRALNLIWALQSTGKLSSATKVTVVGAGLAGLTAALAAKHVGAQVTLLESKMVPLHMQRGCQLRFIHPNILDWPAPGSQVRQTDLPLLNWGADMAAKVSNTVLEQWETLKKDINQLYGHEVRQIRIKDGRPLVWAEASNKNYNESCDVLILAVGFGLERTLPSIPSLSYWENDNYGRSVLSGPIPRHYLVTGCGDGGLIDAIRLCINAFDHAEFVYSLTDIRGLEDLKYRLAKIDVEVRRELKRQARSIRVQIEEQCKREGSRFDENRAKHQIESELEGKLLEAKYQDLVIPDDLRKWLEKKDGLREEKEDYLYEEKENRFREDTVVFLNGPRLTPYDLSSSILNRFVVFLLRQYGGLRYRTGRMEVLSAPAGLPVRVSLRHDEFAPEELSVHEVVVRHGPVAIIDRLFPKKTADDCRPGPHDHDDPTRKALYPKDFLRTDELRKHREQVIGDIASTTLPSSLYEHPATPEQKIPEDSGTSTTTNTPPQSGTPVYSADKNFSFLRCGEGIWNIAPPRADPPLRSIGTTVSCFVRVKVTQKLAILTTATGLTQPGVVSIDDAIVRADEHGLHGGIIAHVTQIRSPRPSSPRSSLAEMSVEFNKYQAAIAELTKDQIDAGFKNSFPDDFVIKAPEGNEFETLQIGTEVVKYGAATGRTEGIIKATSAKVATRIREKRYWYSGVFIVGSTNLDHSIGEHGDSGALVVRKADGMVLGIIIGGVYDEAIVCPIQRILEEMECEFWVGD